MADGNVRGPRSWSSHPPRNIPRPQVVRWLEHAYALRDALEPAWTARPLALVQGRPMLLFEDPGGEVLESFLGHPLELTQFLRMAIGLAVALGRLHGPGVSFTRTSRRQYSS